jgi:hypothetical protein
MPCRITLEPRRSKENLKMIEQIIGKSQPHRLKLFVSKEINKLVEDYDVVV